MAPHLSARTVILTREAAAEARRACPSVELTELSLANLGISIRDFPEETSIFLLQIDEESRTALKLAPHAAIPVAPSRAVSRGLQ